MPGFSPAPQTALRPEPSNPGKQAQQAQLWTPEPREDGSLKPQEEGDRHSGCK